MIDSYSNQIESFRIIFNDDFDELIDEFFKSYNYMLHDYLKKIAKMKNEFKPIYINKKLLKHVSKYKSDDDDDDDDENNNDDENKIDDDENNKMKIIKQ